MKTGLQSFRCQSLRTLIALAMLLPLILYAIFTGQRPPREPMVQPLFTGITYERQVRDRPRPLMIHLLTVDLTVPEVQVIVSGGVETDTVTNETIARTTSEFLQESGVQIAVNGSFFFPFREKTPWDYAPHSGDRVFVLGQAIAAGKRYAEPRKPWHPFCILSTGKVLISAQYTCPQKTEFALAGGPLLLLAGEPVDFHAFVGNFDKPYARLLIATNATGDKLWLIAVDGKQPFYSDGMTLAETVEFLQELGVTQALNLDGGGSTTLVQAQAKGQPKILNAPIQTKIPMRERAIANHIGIYAPPLSR